VAKRDLLLAVGALFFISTGVVAETFVMPLDVDRNHEAGKWVPFEIDLGLAFCSIREVRFACEGTITGGLDCQSEPFSWSVKAYLHSDAGSMVARGPLAGGRTYPNPESFKCEPKFEPLWGAKWDFLLDGRATGRVGMSEVCTRVDTQPTLLPSAHLTKASLIIDATVLHPTIVFYVDADAPGANDGSSWKNAYNCLQDALSAASYGDEIRVAQGLYKPDLGAGVVAGDRRATFELQKGLTIMGGYAGFGRPDPDARDVRAFETILSGDLRANDTDRMNSPSRAENSYHVVTASNTDASAVLNGFTITAGYANGFGNPDDSGGGMYVTSGSPTIVNCTFIRNAAVYAGGMANRDYCSPKLVNCTFFGNSVHAAGGAMYNWKSNVTLINCSFAGNFARCGAAMMVYDSSAKLCNSVFTGNFAREDGGAMYLNISDVTMTNCTLSGNVAGHFFGGGIYNHDAKSDVSLANCILWNNRDNGGPDESAQIHGGIPFLRCCCIQGWTAKWGGSGNTGNDPLFVREPSDGQDGWGTGNRSEFGELLSIGENDDFGDLHLCSRAGRWDPNSQEWTRDLVTSPCIDGGAPECDVGGEPAPHGNRVNMGAYGGTAQASKSVSGAVGMADLNDDGIVNFHDFSRLAADWGTRQSPSWSDFDGDMKVDFRDLAFFSGTWLAY
jgi:hypothetical protein